MTPGNQRGAREVVGEGTTGPACAARLLVVDDEPIALRGLRRLLGGEGRRVVAASSGSEALRLLDGEPFDVVLTDLVMDAVDGMQVLACAKDRDPETQVIVVTGHASVGTAVEAIKRGAFHYLQKPLHPDEVRHVVRLALEKRQLRTAVESLQRRLTRGDARIIGTSPKIVAIRQLVRHVAAADANVLITGGSGTGKELVARAIHDFSARSVAKFLPINCASFTEELVANELFGHEKDAFTGATSARGGLLEAAHGGTIFFDEVGDMPPRMQAKLLRVVQERELIRVGGTRPISIDVRIISATNKDLNLAVADGTFRQDLYYRLNVVPIRVPPLSERPEDIPLLAGHFLDRFNERSRRKILGFAPEVMTVLGRYEFPGNVRELENLVERSASLARSELIDLDALPEDLRGMHLRAPRPARSGLRSLAQVEREHIAWTMSRCGHNRTRAARALGIDRVSLYRKLKRMEAED